MVRCVGRIHEKLGQIFGEPVLALRDELVIRPCGWDERCDEDAFGRQGL